MTQSDSAAAATAAVQPAHAPAAATLPAFVRELLDRYTALRAPDAGRRDVTDAALAELQLADAALRLWPGGGDAQLKNNGAADSRPLQVAVLGPTQVGKSTVVNLLVGTTAAAVSPLAGFTVHAQGFGLEGASIDGAWSESLFPGCTRVARDHLRPERLNEYSLAALGVDSQRAGLGDASAARLPECVVWDSPDFDSLKSHEYRRAVLELAALADVYVLVLSKEKYSDESAWSVLRLLEPLHRPLVIVLNKLTPDAADVIERSLRARLTEQIGGWPDVSVVPLPFQLGLTENPQLEMPDAALALRRTATAALARVDRAAASSGVRTLLRRRWNTWTAPLRCEHAASVIWRDEVDAALIRLIEAYRNEYLDHPQRFDSFRRATIELLYLLELPGVGRTLAAVRTVVTWPARKLFSAGHSWWSARRGARHTPPGDEEVLNDIVAALLTGLRTEAARRAAASDPSAALWGALTVRLEAEEPRIRRAIGEAIRKHQQLIAQEIHTAATELFEILRERPALLNTLRGARVTADLASVLFAIKTGGAHINDLLIAPATFGLVSLMTEGAVGAYMTRIADDLKQRQLGHVRTALIDAVLAPTLRGLADGLRGARLVGLTPERLDAATQALDTWERRPNE